MTDLRRTEIIIFFVRHLWREISKINPSLLKGSGNYSNVKVKEIHVICGGGGGQVVVCQEVGRKDTYHV